MKDKVIVGIDVGTSKISTLIATVPPENTINIIGVSTAKSKGLRKSHVVDIEEASEGILESLEAAERMAGYSVSEALVSVGGTHIASQNSHGVVAVAEPEKEIHPSDIERAIEAAKAISLPTSREIIHVIPREFIVDSQQGIKDPAGMMGIRLEVDTHLITCGSTALRNLAKCLSEVGVDVSGFVFGGLASASATLTETEKELGVVLVDIGGGTTDIAIFVEGALSYSSVLPIGAKNITNDLAIGLRVSLESAEKIKLFLSDQAKKPKSETKQAKKKEGEEELDLSSLKLPEGLKKTTKKTLVDGIIRPRLDEIFTMVGLEIKQSDFGGMTPAGLIITGGGAETVNIQEVAKKNLAMPVRIGIPRDITGLVDEILVPSYATSVGLLVYGVQSAEMWRKGGALENVTRLAKKIPIRGALGKVFDLLKSFLP